jgi:hypothetical protein
MINRRLEVMASEALRTGKVTVTGEQYPTTVVDYGRDAGLTVVLTGANRWGQAGIKPLDPAGLDAPRAAEVRRGIPDVVMTWTRGRSSARTPT